MIITAYERPGDIRRPDQASVIWGILAKQLPLLGHERIVARSPGFAVHGVYDA